MKKVFLFFTQMLVIASLLTPGITAQEFKADRGKTVLNWEGKGVGKAHTGTISLKSGTLSMKSGLPATGVFVFDMNSLTNTDLAENMAGRLIGHLKSDDFFGVETFPEAVFNLTGSEKVDGGLLNIKGNLTIKGKTHPVQFIAEQSLSNGKYRFIGKAEVDRSLYDVKYGSGKFFENLGDKTINDIFTLEFDLMVITPE